MVTSICFAKLLVKLTIVSILLFSSSVAFQSPKLSNNAASSSMCLLKKAKEEETMGDNYKVKTWNPFRLAVLRLGMTELPAISPLNYGKYDGTFNCAYCGQELFDSSAKYDSGSGWPSFWRTSGEGAVAYKMELDGRLECRCKRCQSHIGHVFLDGPKPSSVPRELLESSPKSDPRSKSNNYLPRFCINGAALVYKERDRGLN